jgi:EAL domain-containing protein (putative c-di-GMP-specific phosphodiesterase class I)
MPTTAPEVVLFPGIDELLTGAGTLTAFQPICELASLRERGAEALVRHSLSILSPDALFDYVGRKGRIADFDLTLIGRHLAHAGVHRPEGLVFLNVHPHTLGDDRLVGVLFESAIGNGIGLERIVLEITEQSSIPAGGAPLYALRSLVAGGVRLALDDVGSAYSHFSLLEHVEIHFMKITQLFGRDLAANAPRRRVVRNLARLAEDFGMEVILEGIDCEVTIAEALDLGVTLGQGYHLARPVVSPSVFPRAARG